MTTFPLVCEAPDGEQYRVYVPANDEATAAAKATAQGHDVRGHATASTPPTDPKHQYHYGPIALVLSVLGFLFPPLAIAGVILGAYSKDGAAAVKVGALALASAVLFLIALALS